MYRKTTSRIAGAGALALCFGVALGVPAQASDTNPVNGTCSGTSTVKLYTSEHGKGIKVKAKIKTGTAAEAWDWSVSDNGTTVAADQSTTNSNGKLVVRATIPNLDGTDTVDFTATDTVTGETCTAEAVVD